MFDIILTNKSEESQICKYFENISFEVNETTEMKSQAQEKHINIAWPWKQILKLLVFLQFLNSTLSRFSGPSTHSPFVQKDAVENSSSSVISYNLVANTPQEPLGCCPRLTFKIQIHWQIDVGSDLWKPSPISCSPGGSIQLCCLEQPNPELLQTLRHGHVPGFVSDISPLRGENS